MPPVCPDVGTKGLCPDCQLAESIGGAGGNCPAIKICTKNITSTASCDDKDECTANDKCSGGQCKGEPIRVNITAGSATICVGRSKVFAAQSTPSGRAINWAASGGASVDASGVVTGVSVGVATITASDAKCEKANGTTAIEIMDKSSSATGQSEFSSCFTMPVACAVAADLRDRIDPSKDQDKSTWVSTNFQSVNKAGDCRANREGSERDAATHAYLSCMLYSRPCKIQKTIART